MAADEWSAPTEAQWLQWRLDFAKGLEGVTLRYEKFQRWSPSWDHEHCAACSITFAEFDGREIQHEGYTTCEDYRHGARYEWICRTCFEDLRDLMGWKLAHNANLAAPDAPPRATYWGKGKLPRIECSITFLSPEEGGRHILPQSLTGNLYRPHLVVRDPSQKAVKAKRWNKTTEEYIGVAFLEGPAAPEANKEIVVVLSLTYFPNPIYGKLRTGTAFTLREGANVVANGTVRRWLD